MTEENLESKLPTEVKTEVRDKGREKMYKFDSRGVQTLFRTVSRNHYTLLRMVDNKASIILTMNSIIISLLMGALYVAPETVREAATVGARILVNFSMFSMIFALFSMLPHKYLGKPFKQSRYRGSLYAGNYSSLSLEEFKKEFDRIMSSGKTVYDEMIEDFYFLGKAIARKQYLLLFSVAIFLAGLMTTFIYSAMNGFELFGK